MAKGPKGEKRPRDVVGAAVKSMKILTDDDVPSLDTVDEEEMARIRAKTAKSKNKKPG